ncbi:MULTISPECIES: CysB family HTH-type transcriptional regulator [Rhodomicrobium]|uniref:CysB family HTH-type transcriptional regulator n=1 Tax=Rhodomicrobium TaxID=1068 RepID=UPI000B4C0411|nr:MULTISPECIES: CysB family HTH-type transcriptional regulator [Rhodomicrobium]
MNFQQLRIVRETVRCNYNLTDVAAALYTSQSGVSKHIKDLEDELGVELFVRRGKRLLGLTAPGQELSGMVERILLDAANVRHVAQQFAQSNRGELVVATTHTQARYALPEAVAAFRKMFPEVRLVLQQGTPAELAKMLLNGEADIAIATEALLDSPDILAYPYYSWRHGVVVPQNHPLTEIEPLTLEAIAEWPIITYHEGFTGRGHVDDRFAAAGLNVDIVISALDADVIKTYVELGVGVGIMASMAFVPERDKTLRFLDCSAFFDEQTSLIAVRRGRYLRGYAYRFIELCAANLTERVVRGDAALLN